MFRFAQLDMFWLLGLIPIAIFLYILSERLQRRRMERFGRFEALKRQMPEMSIARGRTKFGLFAAAIAFIIVALARPQVGSQLRSADRRGIEIVFAIDVSNSMLAEDFTPSRLEMTKRAVSRIMEGLSEQRTGVVIFAGEAYVQLPITADITTARTFVERISTTMVSNQGTNIGAAIDLATGAFTSSSEGSRVVVLITDGENHGADAIAAARHAAELGINIYVVGIGTPEGAPIRIEGDYMKDDNGQMVVSKLDEEGLQQIALATDGAYIRADRRNLGLEDIINRINSTHESALQQLEFERYNELYPYPLAFALLLLLVEFAVLPRKNRWLSKIKLFS